MANKLADKTMEKIATDSKEAGLKERLVSGLGYVPQNLLSYAVGALVRIEWPKAIQIPINKGFVGLFKLNMGEAEKPLRDYKSIEDIFTRALLPNQREVSSSYVSSADGMLEMSRSALSGNQAVQAKGIEYSLAELVSGSKALDIGARWYTTVYLAPHNYHRVHAPFTGQVKGLRYIPGRLWPVNRPAVRAIPGLFSRNERLVFDFELASGGKAWVVMVGAFNVGRMMTRLSPDFVTNAASGLIKKSLDPVELTLGSGTVIKAGEELGVFMLGSTTVVVLDQAATEGLKPKETLHPEKVYMGQSLSQ